MLLRTNELFKTTCIPTILVCGETPDSCSCDELGTKQVIYYREYAGMVKKFREIVCEDCMKDYEFTGKTIVSITDYKSEKQAEEDYYFNHN